jgi:hypothetical protein
LKFRDFAPGRAGADPASRGARSEAGDGSVAQTCSSVCPAGADIGFGGVCVSKTEYWDQLPSWSSESKREDAAARFLRRGIPYGFLAGYHVLPIQKGILSQLQGMPAHPTDTNVRNALENIVRIERGKIVIHYTIAGSKSQ